MTEVITMKSTYVGILEDDVNEIKTLVPAEDEHEARGLILYKFRTEFGLDFDDKNVVVCRFAFGDC